MVLLENGQWLTVILYSALAELYNKITMSDNSTLLASCFLMVVTPTHGYHNLFMVPLHMAITHGYHNLHMVSLHMAITTCA